MENIMLDLETLGTNSNSIVLSLGAVSFDTDGNLGDSLYMEFTDDLAFQLQHGAVIDVDTIKWWMQQDDAARAVFGAPKEGQEAFRVSTTEGLRMFAEFVGRNGGDECKIWGNGAAFDNVILANLYKRLNMAVPWKFWNDRCFRTLKTQFGLVRPPVHEGVEHHALADALNQVRYLQEVYRCLATQ